MTDFNVPIPTDELDAKPSFLLPPGWYGTVLQAGAEVVQNDFGWKGLRIPFAGFTSKKDGKTYERDRRFQVTIENPNSEKSVEIGRQQATAVAIAFGLAEDTTVAGKPAKRMTAKSPEELAEQLNSVAGSPCDVYVVTKKRKRDGAVVMRDDGQGPVLDNEVSRVAAYGEGK